METSTNQECQGLPKFTEAKRKAQNDSSSELQKEQTLMTS